jgi:Na+/H+ antiporter NhaA
MAVVEPSETSSLTTWLQRDTALRRFLQTETASAALLLGAALAALIWANVDTSSYEHLWRTRLSVHLGDDSLSLSLRDWVNSGLMSFFFLVVGLEARREFDIGEFRERPRIILPVLAGLGGMAAAIGIYLAINAGRSSADGWGVAMSTDTAFALGLLALLGRHAPERLRGFILTLTVVDDIVGLIVIATVYTHHLTVAPLIIAAGLMAIAALAAWRQIHFGLLYFALAAASWVALVESGVDPVVVGLAAGLISFAAPPTRPDLERTSDLFRDFREQPTAGMARQLRAGVRTAVSPNERLEQIWHPWSSYLIVPLFGLANAGIPIDVGFLAHAYASPITLGIMVGYVVGKPAGIMATSALVNRATGGRLRPPVGWMAALGGGTLAGMGFTVSLLVASVAFTGVELREATLGVLTASVIAAVLTWLVFWITGRLPLPLRTRALLGQSPTIVDLADPVDADRDHIRGPADAHVTLVEYGDFECPYCGQAEPVIRELLTEDGDLRYVWRHLPLNDVHPEAQLAAEASEAAAAQGAFWPMHDLLIEHQTELGPQDLMRYAQQLGLDMKSFTRDLRSSRRSERVAADVESADLSGVAGTPSFFVNGQRQVGGYDLDSLGRAVRTARAQAAIGASRNRDPLA